MDKFVILYNKNKELFNVMKAWEKALEMTITKLRKLHENVCCAVEYPQYVPRLINYEEETDFDWWVTKMDTGKISNRVSYAYILMGFDINIWKKKATKN